jgi:hypothetical protein
LLLCRVALRGASSNLCFVLRKNIDEERAACVTCVAGKNNPHAERRSDIECGHASRWRSESPLRKTMKGEEMQKRFSDPRIAGMFAGDRAWSLVAVVVLWLLYAFVFYEVKDYAGSSEVIWALIIAGGLVVLFNTASIIAMIAHLSEERDEIYGLDLHYLDLRK